MFYSNPPVLHSWCNLTMSITIISKTRSKIRATNSLHISHRLVKPKFAGWTPNRIIWLSPVGSCFWAVTDCQIMLLRWELKMLGKDRIFYRSLNIHLPPEIRERLFFFVKNVNTQRWRITELSPIYDAIRAWARGYNKWTQRNFSDPWPASVQSLKTYKRECRTRAFIWRVERIKSSHTTRTFFSVNVCK